MTHTIEVYSKEIRFGNLVFIFIKLYIMVIELSGVQSGLKSCDFKTE